MKLIGIMSKAKDGVMVGVVRGGVMEVMPLREAAKLYHNTSD